MTDHKDIQKAILIVCFGFGIFAISDALLKMAMAELSPIEVLCYHSLFGSLALAIYFTFSKRWHSFSSKSVLKWQVLRGIMGAVGGLLNLYALQFISLDQFYTIVFSAPIMTSLFSIIFLKEQVQWQRWVGIIMGFVGVLIVINPFHMTINPYAFLCLVSAAFFSIGSIILRRLNTPHPQVFGFAFIPFLMSAIIPLFILIAQEQPLSAISHEQSTILAITGICGALGSVMIARAFTIADVSIVAPYHYTQMFWGVLLGYLFFSDIPNLQTLIGCTLIIGSGLFILYREHVTRKQQRVIMMQRMPVMVATREKKNSV